MRVRAARRPRCGGDRGHQPTVRAATAGYEPAAHGYSTAWHAGNTPSWPSFVPPGRQACRRPRPRLGGRTAAASPRRCAGQGWQRPGTQSPSPRRAAATRAHAKQPPGAAAGAACIAHGPLRTPCMRRRQRSSRRCFRTRRGGSTWTRRGGCGSWWGRCAWQLRTHACKGVARQRSQLLMRDSPNGMQQACGTRDTMHGPATRRAS